MAGPLAAAGKMVTAWNQRAFALLRAAKGCPSMAGAAANRRQLSSKAPAEESAQKAPQPPPPPPPASPNTSSDEASYVDVISPSKWNKKILVLTRRYKKEEDIPEFVPNSVMQAATSRLRMYIGTGITILTLIGFFFAALSGKQSIKEGRSQRVIHMEKKAKLTQAMAENGSPKV